MAGKTYTKDELVAVARASATKYGIDPDWYVAQIQQESGFNPNAVSSAGAKGVAQFVPATAKEFGLNPLDPIASLDAGAKYMSQLSNQFGNETLGRLAYNWGQGNVRRWLRDPSKIKLPKEAADYNTAIAKRGGLQAQPLSVARAGGDAPQTVAAKPAPQQIEQRATGPADQLAALEQAGAEINAGLPPAPVAVAPQQQLGLTPDQLQASAGGGAQDPMAWMQNLPGGPVGTGGVGSGGVGTNFLDQLQTAAAKSQDNALANMFSDTPQVDKKDPFTLPGGIDRYLNKILA